MPSGPGGSASDPESIAARRAAFRATCSDAAPGSSLGCTRGAGTSAITRSMTPVTAAGAESSLKGTGRSERVMAAARRGRCPGMHADAASLAMCGVRVDGRRASEAGERRGTKSPMHAG